jgi:hypothetical protein
MMGRMPALVVGHGSRNWLGEAQARIRPHLTLQSVTLDDLLRT